MRSPASDGTQWEGKGGYLLGKRLFFLHMHVHRHAHTHKHTCSVSQGSSHCVLKGDMGKDASLNRFGIILERKEGQGTGER